MSIDQNGIKYIKEYDCLRVMATLIVVLGHCTYFRIDTDFGGIDYSELARDCSLMFLLYQKLKKVIYVFHMPLFLALSGALFQISLNRGGYSSLKNFAYNKTFRLLIPFAVISVAYSFPIKSFAGYYLGSTCILFDFIIGQLLVQGNTYLWFLPTLFLIFLVTYIVENIVPGCRFLKVAISLIIYVLSSKIKIEIEIATYVVEYLLWFYVGYYFEEFFRERVNKFGYFQQFIIFTVSFVLLILYFIIGHFNTAFLKCICMIVKVTLISCLCLCFYIVSLLLSKTKITESRLYKTLKKDSFGIYLYSDPWNYVFLSIGTKIYGDWIFSSNVGATIFYVVRFLVR